METASVIFPYIRAWKAFLLFTSSVNYIRLYRRSAAYMSVWGAGLTHGQEGASFYLKGWSKNVWIVNGIVCIYFSGREECVHRICVSEWESWVVYKPPLVHFFLRCGITSIYVHLAGLLVSILMQVPIYIANTYLITRCKKNIYMLKTFKNC